MNNNCLNEQDLTLLYYGELPESCQQQKHLAECTQCTNRFALLKSALDRLPKLEYSEHPATATRMAARVIDNVDKPGRRWIPAVSTLAVSACALLATLLVWSPSADLPQTVQRSAYSPATMNLEEDMPDIEFLEDMDLLLELDLLSQVEGV